MAFIRTKKIKGAEYAYIVENRWKRKKTKQKSKKYLGRVYRFDRVNMMDFYEFYGISDVDKYLAEKSKEEIIVDLIKLELFNHGFNEEKNCWRKGNCFLNLKEKKIYNEKGNNIALAFNEGFMTTYALRKLHNFRADVEEEGYDFAKLFVEAGISIPKDVFVGIFSKVYK
ncbi:hypothetical protein KY332_03975 [Candidatus Woesearchaeota archaeon]|nr:hypothetical protein [Candidatus Woesearchaeota archaeon]